MTIARVAGQDASGIGASGSVSVSFPGATTAGHLLLCAVWGLGTGPGTNGTPSGWTVAKDVGFGSGGTAGDLTLFYKQATGSETSVTSTASGGGAMQMELAEFSGVANPIALDGTAATGTSGASSIATTAAFKPSITLSQATSLIVQILGPSNTITGIAWAAATGITTTNTKMMLSQWLPGSTGTFSDTATWTTARTASALIVAFKSAAATVTGAASETIGVTASATGHARVNGAAAATISVTASVAGRVRVDGVASETISVTAAAAGRVIVKGAAAMTISVVGAASAKAIVKGSASATVGVIALAIGDAVTIVQGTATATIAVVAALTGHDPANTVVGTAATVIAVTASAAGHACSSTLFNAAVINNRHVVWQRLTVCEQTNLTLNYPCSAGVDPPGADVCGDDVDPRFEQWLDGAYVLRHATDNLDDDMTF